jgi:hypothetical protein
MSWIKKTAYYYCTSLILFVVISTVITVVLFEFYCQLNPGKFYSYGWATDNITQVIIDKCEARYGKKKVNIILGDSFVEFYGDREINLVKLLAKNDSQNNYCNFGISGTGPKTYKNRLDLIFDSQQINVDQVIVFLYEGNDFSDYLQNHQIDTGTSDRRNSWAMNFFKRSYTFNIIYRSVIKKYTSSDLDPRELIKTVGLRDINLQKSMEIFSKTPKNLIENFKVNLLNVSWFSVALAMPNYFERTHSPTDAEFEIQKDISLRPINEMINISKKYNKNINFFIIPHDFFLFDNAQKRWHETFRFEKNDALKGMTRMSNHLISSYDNVFYPIEIFNSEDFIIDDGHLTHSGNNKLSRFCIDKIYH